MLKEQLDETRESLASESGKLAEAEAEVEELTREKEDLAEATEEAQAEATAPAPAAAAPVPTPRAAQLEASRLSAGSNMYPWQGHSCDSFAKYAGEAHRVRNTGRLPFGSDNKKMAV